MSFSFSDAQLVKTYPTDPNVVIQRVLSALTSHNVWDITSAVYELVGYVLFLVHGQEHDVVSAENLLGGFQQVVDLAKVNGVNIPPWVLPLLLQALTWLQSFLSKKS